MYHTLAFKGHKAKYLHQLPYFKGYGVEAEGAAPLQWGGDHGVGLSADTKAVNLRSAEGLLQKVPAFVTSATPKAVEVTWQIQGDLVRPTYLRPFEFSACMCIVAALCAL
jgi:hypothetical protein